jgi:hypothetical protein
MAYGATRSVDAGVSLFLVSANGIGVLIAAICRTLQQALLRSFFGLFPIMFLSGSLAPVNSMPALPQPLSLGGALRHYIEVILGIVLKGVGLWCVTAASNHPNRNRSVPVRDRGRSISARAAVGANREQSIDRPGPLLRPGGGFQSHRMTEGGHHHESWQWKSERPGVSHAGGTAREHDQLSGHGLRFLLAAMQGPLRANPHLYIGVPGERAPKQTGQEVIRRRRLKLEMPLADADMQRAREHLLAMMGVYSVDIDADKLVIAYDLLQATAAQIEATLQQAGVHLSEGWPNRLRRAFVHYLEETEVASREVRPGPDGHGGHHHS